MHASRLITSLLLLDLAAAGRVMAQNCPGSDPPRDYCSTAYVLPGTPGLHEVVMDVSTATAPSETSCNAAIGHSVWFSVTPTLSGTLTFTTCHPRTTYDTVAQAFKGGESSCEFMTYLECNDDTADVACFNGCSASGSTLQFEVTSGTQYRFQVGSYNNNSANCNLCLGVYVFICNDLDFTPPITEITSPSGLACVCGIVPIIGSVYGSSGDLRRYRLEYASAVFSGWNLISTETFEITNGVLGYWNTIALGAEGYYILRLTAEDICGNVSSAMAVAWVDKGMNTVRLDAPSAGQILGGTICADGTVWDNCLPGVFGLDHRPIGGVVSPFDSVNPPWITNNPLGSWNTLLGTVDGDYEIQLIGQDNCGNLASANRIVTVDNTPPIAVVALPLSCTFVNGVVQVVGTANDAHLLNWRLYYSGGDAHDWTLIAGGSTAVVNSVLANWNTVGLRSCAYALRLVVTDQAVINCNGAIHNETEYVTLVGVGKACDLNGDGFANGMDVQPFVNCLFAGP